MGGLNNSLDLTGRRILVTGASSGIGKSTAIYLSRLGARLIVTGRNVERLRQTLAELAGSGHSSFVADLALEEDLTRFFDEIMCDGDRLSGMVHCAGIPYVMPLQSLTKKRVAEAMENNFFPLIELVRQYAKKKYSCGGSIVGISSVLAVQPRKYEAAYIASKAAMNAAIACLSFELARRDIRINGILAGNIMTDMVTRSLQENDPYGDFRKMIENRGLLGVGEPNDIAGVCAFLISDMSRFMTGRMIYADGGLL